MLIHAAFLLSLTFIFSHSLSRCTFPCPVFIADLCPFTEMQSSLEGLQPRTATCLCERSAFPEFCHSQSCDVFKFWLTMLLLLVPRSHSEPAYIQQYLTQGNKDKKMGQNGITGCLKGTIRKEYGATYKQGYSIQETLIFFLSIVHSFCPYVIPMHIGKCKHMY